MIQLFPAREIAFTVFGWQINWYGVMYVLAFLTAWVLAPRLQKYRGLKLTRDDWLYVFAWGVAGVLIGGRLGYAVFYEPQFFLQNPLHLFAIWNGGMSSHGGFVGVGLALWHASRRLKIKFLSLADVLVVPIALGLAFGRFGNWINQELYPGNLALIAILKDLIIAGTCFVFLEAYSSSSKNLGLSGWSHFAKASRDKRDDKHHKLPSTGLPLRSFANRQSEGWTRHFIIFRRAISRWIARRNRRLHSGSTTAVFLILYATLRFLTEYIRLPEWPTTLGLTRGQLLTVPVLLVGLWLLLRPPKVKLTPASSSATPN